MPSKNVNIQKAVHYVADYEGITKMIMPGDKEKTVEVDIQQGKYDQEVRHYDEMKGFTQLIIFTSKKWKTTNTENIILYYHDFPL